MVARWPVLLRGGFLMDRVLKTHCRKHFEDAQYVDTSVWHAQSGYTTRIGNRGC